MIILTWLVILFSFLNFSAWYYPLLNTDTAVGILMSPGYTLPGDLYYWGQNHFGSLISFLANILIVTYLFPAALAFSAAYFAVLTAGFFAMGSLLKSPHLKFLLALMWFLPAWHFQDQVVSSAGIAMSTLAIGIWLLNLSLLPGKKILRNFFLSLACIAFIVTVWVYDQMAVSLLIILGIGIWRLYPLFRKGNFSEFIRQKDISGRIMVTLFWTLVGFLFIFYAKHRAVQAEIPASFEKGSPVTGIFVFLSETFSSFIKVMLYRSGNVFASVFAWVLIGGFFWILSFSRNRRNFIPFIQRNKWFTFFMINTVVIFIAGMVSQRFSSSFSENVFFAVSFISFWIAFLLFIEATGSEKRQLRVVLIYVIALTGSISSFLPFYIPERIPSKIHMLSEMKRLNDAGVIGSYQNAYPVACAMPKKIHATPNDSDLILNPQIITDVFKQPNLFIIKDGWFDVYPDTLRQFGQILLKKGNEFSIGGVSFCRYDRYIYSQAFGPAEMKFQGVVSEDKDAVSGKSVKIDSLYDRKKHFVFGPFIPLNQGKIKVDYRLKGDDNLSIDPAAVLEVSAEYGKKILSTKTIRWCDFQKKSHYEDFDMIVDIPENYKGVEFRIMFLGGKDLWFDRVEMTGM